MPEQRRPLSAQEQHAFDDIVATNGNIRLHKETKRALREDFDQRSENNLLTSEEQEKLHRRGVRRLVGGIAIMGTFAVIGGWRVGEVAVSEAPHIVENMTTVSNDLSDTIDKALTDSLALHVANGPKSIQVDPAGYNTIPFPRVTK